MEQTKNATKQSEDSALGCGIGKLSAAEQVRRLLEAPPIDTLKGVRNRAILATLLYHGLRREELCLLRLCDLQSRIGVPHFAVRGKQGKTRYIPAHPPGHTAYRRVFGIARETRRWIGTLDRDGPMFRPVKNNRTGALDRHLDPRSIYQNVVMKYGYATGIDIEGNGLCVHSTRATAATNALLNKADITKVQEWLGHGNVSTTRLYDHRDSQPEDSPTFHVKY